jgi:hypothetical protein
MKPEESSNLTDFYGEHLAYHITTAATADIADGITYLCTTSNSGGYQQCCQRSDPISLLRRLDVRFGNVLGI